MSSLNGRPVLAEVNGPRWSGAAASPLEVEDDAAPGGDFVPFPTEVLPEPLRRFVERGSAAMGCDPSFLAVPTLVCIAGSVGNAAVVELKQGWTEPAIVWGGIVGRSGSLKSPPIELAMRPLRRRQHMALKAHRAAMEEYEAKLARWKRDQSVWERRGGDDEAPPEKPAEPAAERCWTDDATVEAVAALHKENPRGLTVVRDELAGWFGFDRYSGGKGGAEVAKWLEMFGGRPMVVDRKGGGLLYIPRAAVSICGGIQPRTLRRVLGREHRDNGLAARLLMAYPPQRVKSWNETVVDRGLVADLERVSEHLFMLDPGVNEDGDAEPRVVGLSAAAKRRWVRFYDEHAREQVELDEDLAAAWSKLEGYAARLSLLVHLVRWAADDPSLTDYSALDERDVAAGITMSRWFGNEARRVYAMLDETEEEEDQRTLVERVRRHEGAMTPRDLMRACTRFKSAKKAEAALGELVKAGLGVWEVAPGGKQGGRPSKRFRLCG